VPRASQPAQVTDYAWIEFLKALSGKICQPSPGGVGGMAAGIASSGFTKHHGSSSTLPVLGR
jgi:hypothetical protein